MSVIDRLRQARNADQIAQEIEPLAQAMAALSDELKGTLSELREASVSTRGTLETGTQNLNGCTQDATKQAGEIAKLFNGLIEEQRKSTRKFSARMWALALLASLTGGAGAGIGLWIWQSPSKPVEQAAQRWNEVATTYGHLDLAKKRQFRELMGWPEPKAEATGRPRR